MAVRRIRISARASDNAAGYAADTVLRDLVFGRSQLDLDRSSPSASGRVSRLPVAVRRQLPSRLDRLSRSQRRTGAPDFVLELSSTTGAIPGGKIRLLDRGGHFEVVIAIGVARARPNGMRAVDLAVEPDLAWSGRPPPHGFSRAGRVHRLHLRRPSAKRLIRSSTPNMRSRKRAIKWDFPHFR